MAELESVINRPKFNKYLTTEEREEFLVSFLVRMTLVEVTESEKVCRVPKDDKFLNLSFCSSADYLVTGDEDLLVLSSYRGTQILSARDFLDWVEQE